MFDLWAAEHSVLREKVLERIFLTELSRVLLIGFGTPFEVLRSEFDANGYDVVVEARGIVRHAQLKATRLGGKRTTVDINTALADKPGGCVIWFMVDQRTLDVGPFYWLGGPPGSRLPALGARAVRHTRANAAGRKAERLGIREVSRGRFTRMERIEEVAVAMFGASASDHAEILSVHLAAREGGPTREELLAGQSFEESGPLAHRIDGYVLATEAGLGDPIDFAEARRTRAEYRGYWEGTVLELWLQLFMEHRRERFGGYAVGLDLPSRPDPLLDDLCRSLVAAIDRA
jgi:hypothetical protein